MTLKKWKCAKNSPFKLVNKRGDQRCFVGEAEKKNSGASRPLPLSENPVFAPEVHNYRDIIFTTQCSLPYCRVRASFHMCTASQAW